MISLVMMNVIAVARDFQRLIGRTVSHIAEQFGIFRYPLIAEISYCISANSYSQLEASRK
jgi:hypothetical protein